MRAWTLILLLPSLAAADVEEWQNERPYYLSKVGGFSTRLNTWKAQENNPVPQGVVEGDIDALSELISDADAWAAWGNLEAVSNIMAEMDEFIAEIDGMLDAYNFGPDQVHVELRREPIRINTVSGALTPRHWGDFKPGEFRKLFPGAFK